jgi:hypothetical protein
MRRDVRPRDAKLRSGRAMPRNMRQVGTAQEPTADGSAAGMWLAVNGARVDGVAHRRISCLRET